MPSAFGISPNFWQNGVLDRDVVDPSLLTPANGDRFIVGPSAIGVWVGQDNNIAEFNATFSVWSFSFPVEGWTTYIIDEDIYVRYTGIAWVILGSAALNLLIEEANVNIASSVDTINFTGGLNVIDNGSGKVTIDVTGDAIAVEDDGVGIISNLVTLNLGSNLTVTNNGSGKVTIDSSDSQNLWETIIGDSGSVIANTITDTLNILGTASEIITSAATDNVIIGIADNPILPGTGSFTTPIGTTAQRPGTPTIGMLRYNSDLNCTECWDGTKWVCLRTNDTITGGLYQMIYSVNGIIKNAWMDNGADNVSSNSTPAVCLAKSRIRAYTFTNSRDGADSNLEIYRTPEGIEPTVQQDLLDTWNIVDSRTRRKSNFGSDIILEAGDKIGVFSREPGPGSTSPSSAIFIIFLQYLEENSEEVTDNTVNNMLA